MKYLLVLHISLGALLVVSFIIRFIIVVGKKKDPKFGRTFVEGLGAALVASGIALGIITRSPLTGACIGSIAIISVIVASEYVFYQLVKNKLSVPKQ